MTSTQDLSDRSLKLAAEEQPAFGIRDSELGVFQKPRRLDLREHAHRLMAQHLKLEYKSPP